MGPFQSRDNYASAADVKFVIVMHRYMYDLQDMHVGWSVVPASSRRRAFGITQTMAFEFHEKSSLGVSVLDVDMPLLTVQEETLEKAQRWKELRTSAVVERHRLRLDYTQYMYLHKPKIHIVKIYIREHIPTSLIFSCR